MQIFHAELAVWRYVGLALGWRVGLAWLCVELVQLCVRKGENGASLQAEIRGFPFISNLVTLSHLGFCENIDCEPHCCAYIGILDSVIAGPIVPFPANSGSIICNEAPLWCFLPTSFAEACAKGFWLGFCQELMAGLLAGLLPRTS